jgi:two-component system, NtrC family, nitrogen regulation sensor histidine kinase NtrY
VRRHLAFAAAALSFLVLFALLIWQGSFRIEYAPSDRSETVVVWAVSTVIFLLTVVLAFMLFRAAVKVYIDRQRNREGSRIRSKLLIGALVLTLTPTLFYVVFSVYVLNRHLDAWFSAPARHIQADLEDLDSSYRQQTQKRVQAETNWVSLLPAVKQAAETGHIDSTFFRELAQQHGFRQILLTPRSGVPVVLFQSFEKRAAGILHASAEVVDGDSVLGRVSIQAAEYDDRTANDLSAKASTLRRFADAEAGRSKIYQDTYFRLICLITVFVLFFASWMAQILSRQISVPISALLGAAREVRRGNLSYRVRVNAIDEIATLVKAFNEMTSDLEGNARELEVRRRFMEAILESIPTGVISLSPDEQIERVNRALSGIFPPEIASSARKLSDLFSAEDVAEIRYLMKRARRTGAAASQLELQRQSSVLHLAVTVASLEERRGFVLVLEDTSDLLRAQKAAAWQEVARRIAHEIKNPLTPISLCAERIGRQIGRLTLPPETKAILDECTQTIQQEVQTVKALVDEFSQFSRFPTAKPVSADLNEIVESAMSVFADRLERINLMVHLSEDLPSVFADKEQIRRVIVNLVDNAAEAMIDAPVRELRITTAYKSPEIVELSVSDTGTGVSATDKEKLFLPYFSTKARGTGLGLAIVSRIVTEHQGRVRVEDNVPSGTRFIVELNTMAAADLPALDTLEAVPASLRA